ncbi:amidohydrolase [Streptomyces bathyalis]|uniref:Amidohydrolase n=1 Tax=Streptomyces bathyalis TaxID=2710756 RepID=A0A7T1T2R8_9ACTN|nr:amidohydrolase [Streptomyces bathyalis]QPP05280.1 amidohydrolase [Streptomyces bathyalis]
MTVKADVAHRNARIHTLDPAQPLASVLLVADGTLVAIGGEELLEQVEGAPEIVDHGGSVLMPSLADVHNHHMIAGRADLYELQLDASADLSVVLDAIQDWSADLAPDAWVVGGGWGIRLIPELSDLKALAALDEAAGGRPVLLRDDSCHNRWVSSAALALAGIDAAFPDPTGGTIVRDPATRAPVGLLFESAVIPLEHAYIASAPTTVEQDAAACRRGIEILHTFGVTAFQDAAASAQMLAALKHLDDTGRLDAWVVTSLQINDHVLGTTPIGQELIDRRETYRSPHHRPDFVKIFLDGVPPARTASFLESYLPDDVHGGGWRGNTMMSLADLTGWLLRVAEQGLSAKIHSTGDGAVRMSLDAIAAVRAAGHAEPRFQIAHGQYIAEEDQPRLAELDVIADISPPLWYPGPIHQALCNCLPRDRAERLHPNRNLLDAGVLVAGGSDWPVVPAPNPWHGIQGLVTRADPTGTFPGHVWPEQAITLHEAVYAYTLGAARAMGTDDVTGSLETGKSAEFIVLDRDPFTVPVDQVGRTTVMQTWFAGRKVYDRLPAA